jgi:hypothetical protein
MMRSAAFAEALRRGAGAWPVLTVDWVARGLDLGRGIYSPEIRVTSLGQVSAVTEDGTGWSEIPYGSGIRSGSLEAVSWSVKVSDPRGELLNMLETYDPRGSAARADWGATGLVAEDWEPLGRGVVADWAREEPFTKLILKTDDTVLRTPIPPGLFVRTEWGSAYDSSIFGTAFPVALGLHDLSLITARGTVPLVNIRYDEEIGYWWMLSAADVVSIDAIYFDGVPQGTAGWSVLRGVYGGAFMTIVAFLPGYQPAKDVIVSCDCQGPDELGGSTGVTLTGAPDQLRAVLEEWVYRSAPLAGWRGPAPIIDSASWDAASEYFALHRFESARRLGADQNAESAAELIQSFLDSYLFTRIHWNELGQLEFVMIDPDDVDPDDDTHLRLDLHHQDGRVPFAPGDNREVYTHIRMPFGFSSADQKFVSAYEAHDVAALTEKVVLPVENVWSQVRLTQDVADLNPQPPADPVPPP